MKKILFSLLIIAGIATIGFAQDGKRKHTRQERQQNRLNKGVAEGRVNEAEQARIQGQINQNQAAIDAAKSDGKVTKTERAQIDQQQDQTSGHIYSQKHDGKNPRPRKKKQQ